MSEMISARRLARLLDAPESGGVTGGTARPVVLDVRWTLGAGSRHADFLAGHVPGARWVDLDTELAGPVRGDGVGGRHPLPDPAALQVTLRGCGLDPGSPVVVYDDGDLVGAARAWWVLGWAGVADVRVLGGGLTAWRAAGLDVQTGAEEQVAEGAVVVTAGSRPTASPAEVAQWSAAGQVLDARAAPRYRGDQEPVEPVAGHVPGAANLPFTEVLDGRGAVRGAGSVRSAVSAAGPDPDQPVVAYCGSGITASVLVLALQEAGVGATLYPGSWSDWISDPARPVERGDADRRPDRG